MNERTQGHSQKETETRTKKIDCVPDQLWLIVWSPISSLRYFLPFQMTPVRTRSSPFHGMVKRKVYGKFGAQEVNALMVHSDARRPARTSLASRKCRRGASRIKSTLPGVTERNPPRIPTEACPGSEKCNQQHRRDSDHGLP